MFTFGARGLSPRGAWVSTQNYLTDDLVTSGGSSWRAKRNNSNKAPASNPADWEKFASKGDTGAAGAAGSQGPQGVAGPAGAVGPTGPAGPTGPQGDTGETGAQGAQGPAGPTGVTPLGPWENGVTYAENDLVLHDGSTWRALRESTGVTPDTINDEDWQLFAQKGDQGEEGPQGPQGSQGIEGAQGPQGNQGAQGAQGPQGAQGVAGAQGPQGDQGTVGPAGVTPMGAWNVERFYAGNDLALYLGSTWRALRDNLGVTPDASHYNDWQIFAQKGDQGAQGTAGPTGPEGPAGQTGSAGSQGAQGPQGATGPTGSQGPQGPQGEQGTPGQAGIITRVYGEDLDYVQVPSSGYYTSCSVTITPQGGEIYVSAKLTIINPNFSYNTYSNSNYLAVISELGRGSSTPYTPLDDAHSASSSNTRVAGNYIQQFIYGYDHPTAGVAITYSAFTANQGFVAPFVRSCYIEVLEFPT